MKKIGSYAMGADCMDTRGNNFLENFEEKVQIRNRTKVVEIVIRNRRYFE